MPDSRPRRPGDGTAGPRAAALLLSGVRLTDGRTVDVLTDGPRIEAVAAAGSLTTRGTRLDLRGYLLLPAPAEPHAHSDTALTASPEYAGARPGDVRRRAMEAALLQLSHGATALRAQVHVTEATGLAPLEAVLAAGRSLRGLTEVITVAVPGPLTGVSGTGGRALLRDAVELGADVVGGRPDLDPDPVRHVETVLGLAAERGLPLDLHTDADDPGALTRLTVLAAAHRPGVSLGPCAGLSRLPGKAASRVADRLAAAAVTVVCLPQGGCAASLLRGAPPVRLLRAAGVRLAAGGGALRDAAVPAGRGDPLEAAYLLAAQHGLGAVSAYEAVSATARAAMGLPGVRIEPGSPAELLAVRGGDLAGALSLAYSRIVVHRGRVVARTSAVREYCDSEAAATLGLPRQGRPGGAGGGLDGGPGGGP